MSDERCQPFRELLPGYALHALDPDEVKPLEKHLRTCADCRASLEEYRAVSEGLLFAVPQQAPPPRVRARLIASLAAERPQTVPAFARRARPNWQWVLGLALVVLLVFNVSTLAQLSALQRQQANLTAQVDASQKALSLVAYPESRTFTVSGKGTGTLVLNSELRSGVLFAWGLEPLDSAHTYQIWLIQPDGRRVSGGLFKPEPGQPFVSAFISSPQPLSDFVGLGVTVEPSGGSPAPTTPRVIGTNF
jgi:anti-sigma-K factor RskA